MDTSPARWSNDPTAYRLSIPRIRSKGIGWLAAARKSSCEPDQRTYQDFPCSRDSDASVMLGTIRSNSVRFGGAIDSSRAKGFRGSIEFREVIPPVCAVGNADVDFFRPADGLDM